MCRYEDARGVVNLHVSLASTCSVRLTRADSCTTTQLPHATLTLYYSRLHTEQKCDIITQDNLANFGEHASRGSCVDYLDALTGNRTCELDCMDGFVKTAGGVITCGPNGNEPWGKLSGSITCEGKFLIFFLFFF